MSRTSSHSNMPLFPLVGALMLTLLLGYLVGRITTVRLSSADTPPVLLQEAVQQPVPTVQITGLSDGNIVGSMEGELRVWLGEQQILPAEDGTFAVPPGPLLVNTISILVPDGMRYVASKRGKKYYTVTEAGGQSIVPGNRIYFKTSEEAQRAGYID